MRTFLFNCVCTNPCIVHTWVCTAMTSYLRQTPLPPPRVLSQLQSPPPNRTPPDRPHSLATSSFVKLSLSRPCHHQVHSHRLSPDLHALSADLWPATTPLSSRCWYHSSGTTQLSLAIIRQVTRYLPVFCSLLIDFGRHPSRMIHLLYSSLTC